MTLGHSHPLAPHTPEASGEGPRGNRNFSGAGASAGVTPRAELLAKGEQGRVLLESQFLPLVTESTLEQHFCQQPAESNAEHSPLWSSALISSTLSPRAPNGPARLHHLLCIPNAASQGTGDLLLTQSMGWEGITGSTLDPGCSYALSDGIRIPLESRSCLPGP